MMEEKPTYFFSRCGAQVLIYIYASINPPRNQKIYRIRQPFFFLGFGLGQSTALIASSNTILSPFCVNAEHSRYLTAPISRAMARPWGYVIGDSFFSFSFSTVSLSSLRSNLVPTRMIGVLGQWWLTSGNHCKLNKHYMLKLEL